MAVLEVHHLKKIYTTRLGGARVQALTDVNFSVEKGEYVAIMGESGSGKTTLLNILASLDRPSSGEVLLNGTRLSAIPESRLAAWRREKLGFVFQDFNLLDTFSIKDNIFLPLVLAKTPVAEMKKRLTPLAEMLGISGILEKYPYEVSGGQKQRAAVARALITKPDLILADEPTGNLDSKSGKIVIDALKDINEHMGKTIIMVTHDPQMASYCSRLILLKDGVILEDLKNSGDQESFYQEILGKMKEL